MQIEREELVQIIQATVESTIKSLEDKGLLGSANSKTANSRVGNASPVKSAYQQTEQLLYNYRNFLKIVEERKQKIEDIKRYGVPQRSSAFVSYGGNSGIKEQKMEEEKKQDAIYAIEKSMETTIQAINLIDECMDTLKLDPYYRILEMRYFEGRTQEDIAVEFGCSQQNISYNKSRLIKELSIKLFPDKVTREYLE